METNEQEQASYDVHAVEQKWRQVWDGLDSFRAGNAPPKENGEPAEKRYALTMFPYPSGDLHMGHAEVMALHDVIARYWWQRGYDVLNPMGWDSFGLPAENAAIRNDEHPATYTYANIDKQYESFRHYAISFDWSRRFNTSDPEYYTWTQWLFLKFRERGLAYRKNSPVNWCPNDQTVLANEQVVDGRCERCGFEVTKRELTQWYFKITDYAQRLLDDMAPLEHTWPERVLNAQRNWIGRSEGAHVDFVVEGRAEPMTVYTTRQDTLFGATFMVVAPDAALAAELVTEEQRPAYDAYLEQVRKESEIDRMSTERPKTGVFLGVHAVNPATGERIPVWAADYVLADYGTGAIMAVPGQRPARLGVREEVRPADRAHGAAARRLGRRGLQRRGPGDQLRQRRGLPRRAGRRRGEGARSPRGWRARPGQGHGQLPAARLAAEPAALLGLPDPDHPLREGRRGPGPVRPAARRAAGPARRGPEAEGRLAAGGGRRTGSTSTCPTCGGPATRDSDTMDTFVDSSWYFLRYCSPHYTEGPFDEAAVREWSPADIYVGGVEHAVLHLLYARFFTKVLHDMGMIDFVEPFSAQLNQGQVINQGKKMSKSLGNGVDLGKQLDEFGVDAVRLTLVFAGPPEDDIDWADMSPGGSLRFLQRAWRLSGDVTSEVGADVAIR